MYEVPQSATGIFLHFGPFVDFSDGVTPETGVDMSSTSSAVIQKYGASSSVITVMSATWAETGSGWYSLAPTSGMFDTLGPAQLRIQRASVHVPFFETINVVHKEYHAYKYGTGYMDVGTVTGNVTGTVASVSSSVVVRAGTIASVSNSVWFTAGTIASVSNSVWFTAGTIASVSNSVSVLPGQTIASVSNSVSILPGQTIASVSNSVWFTAGTIASVSNSVWFTAVRDVGTVTGGIAGDMIGSVGALASAAAIDAWTLPLIESTYTPGNYMMLMGAVLFLESIGGGSASVGFRNVADTANRVAADVDANGNRIAVSLNIA